MRRRIWSLLLSASLCAALPASAEPIVGPCEANDAGGTAASASRIGTPAVCVGTLEMGDADLYAFDVTGNLTIALKVTVTHGTSAGLVLLDPTGADRGASCTPHLSCTVTKAAAGRWIFGVAYRSGVGGRYGVDLVLAPPAPEASCETGSDAPNYSGGGRAVTPPMSCTGAISPAGDTDWFTFTLSGGGSIVASIARLTGGPYFLYVMGPNGVRSCTQSTASLCSVANAERGAWYVGIRALAPTITGEYALTVYAVDAVDPVPTTCEPQDAAATSAEATVVTAPAACTARIRDTSDRDVYAFDLPGLPADVMAVALTVVPANGSEYEVTLTDPSGAPVTCVSERAIACVVRRPEANGRWYASVARGTPGIYVLGLVAVNTNPESLPEAAERAVEGSLAPATCEPSDAGNAAPLPWTSPTETASTCRGSVAGPDDADSYAFPIRSEAATVHVLLQPEARTADLTLALRPPPGACAPETHVDGACPEIASHIGRAGQPDQISHAVPSGAKSGPWTVRIGRLDGEGTYALSVVVQPA